MDIAIESHRPSLSCVMRAPIGRAIIMNYRCNASVMANETWGKINCDGSSLVYSGHAVVLRIIVIDAIYIINQGITFKI